MIGLRIARILPCSLRCPLITTDANTLMGSIRDRMLVILDFAGCDKWLGADEPGNDLLSLLKPFPRDELGACPVSTFVNNPRNQ